jgi:hypothetical protein
MRPFILVTPSNGPKALLLRVGGGKIVRSLARWRVKRGRSKTERDSQLRAPDSSQGAQAPGLPIKPLKPRLHKQPYPLRSPTEAAEGRNVVYLNV